MTRQAAAKTAKRHEPKEATRHAGKPPKGTRRGGIGETALTVNPPPPGEGKRGEAGYLGYLLRQAQAANRLRMERTLADLGVTPPQFVVLTMLNAYPGHSGAELARVALLTPQTVGVIMRNLERDRAIRRTPHPVHGRLLQWTLTSHGKTLLQKCRRRIAALERRLVGGLGRNAELAIRRWLSGIAAALHRES